MITPSEFCNTFALVTGHHVHTCPVLCKVYVVSLLGAANMFEQKTNSKAEDMSNQFGEVLSSPGCVNCFQVRFISRNFKVAGFSGEV